MADITARAIADKDLTVITISGEVDGDEIIECLDRYYGPGMTKNVVWDFLAADVTAVESGDIQRFLKAAASHAAHRDGGKTAFAQASDLGFGLNRMYEITADAAHYPIPLAVFRNLDEALAWIDPGRE